MKNDIPGFSFSQTVYLRLLRAYPQRHRTAYGAAMAQLFRDQCRDAWRESRNWGLLKLWLRILPDLASTSILERLAALNERKTMNDKLANLFNFRTAPAALFFKVFVPVFILVFGASVITWLLPESYASTARIKVESDAPAARGQAPAYDPYFIQTTFEIIQSELVLKPVIEKLNLNTEWGQKYFRGEKLKTAESLEILKSRLQLAPVKNTKLISITVYSDDKNEAAQIANALADSYRDYRNTSHAEVVTKGLQVLRDDYQAQELQIKKSQAELDELQKKFVIPSRVEDLKTETLKKQKLYQEMNAQLTLLHSLSKNQLRNALPSVVQDPALSDLLGKLGEVEQKHATLSNDYLPTNPVVTRVTALTDELNKQIDDRVAGIMAGLESQAASTKTASDTLSRLIEKSTPTSETKPYRDAKQNLQLLIKSHELLFVRYEAEKLDAQIPKPALVEITDTAEPGRAPVKPNKTLNILAGAVAGIFLATAAGAIFALLSLFLGNRLRKPTAAM
jgi:succinoglycan biosynthesis transport protein ExoP